jgi:hypothetical protein
MTTALTVFAAIHDPATAATLSLFPVADATLYEESTTTTANGAGEFLLAGRNNQASNSRRRSLLQFDLSALPAGATITSASLRLHLATVSTAETQLGLHPLVRHWTEGPADPLGNESAGVAAGVGDTSWQFASVNQSPWLSPGGDASLTASASLAVGTTTGYHTWNGDGLAHDVASWAADPATNFGWLLRDSEATPQTAKRLSSREAADQSLRPLLTIEFTPIPEPSATTLLLAGLIVLTRTRRGGA